MFLSLKNKKLDSYEIRSHEELQEQFCDLQNDPSDALQEIAISQFWCAMHKSYQQISELTFRILLPFATTYLGESGFSALSKPKHEIEGKFMMI